MSTTFDPSLAKDALKLPQESALRPKRVYDERVFMQVERFVLSRTGGEEWAVGHSLVNPAEKVMVRLSTAEERMVDLPQANEARLRQSYEGEKRRETLSEKAKSKVQLIAFDGSRPLGVSETGEKQYRAHWPQTIAANSEAEVTTGLGHIYLYQPKEGSGSRAEAYVEFLRTSTIVDRSNIQQAVESALSPIDENGRARDTHAVLRVFHNGQDVATARLFPSREKVEIADPVFGDKKEIFQAVDGHRSFEALISGSVSAIPSMDANNDLVRALVAGLLDEAEPPVSNVMTPGQAENFFHGAKGGQLVVEVVAAERIRFGMDSAKTYLNDRDNIKFANYVVKTEVEGSQPTTDRGYGDTVVAFQRYPNGQPYAVYASPQDNLPRVSPLAEFGASQLPLTAILPEDPKAPRIDASHDNSPGM